MKNHPIVATVLGLLIFASFPLDADQQIPPTRSGKETPAVTSTVNERAEGSSPLVELLQDLKSKDVAMRRKAAFGLSWKSPLQDLRAIPLLIEALSDENADVRREVARVLGKYGSQARAAVPALLKIVKEKDDETRLSAVAALGQIGAEAKEAVPVLVEMLAENNYIVREAAAKALGGVGREACQATESLRKVMADYAPPVSVAAATALWKVSGSARESVPVLVRIVQDMDGPDPFELIGFEIGRGFGIPIPSRVPSEEGSPRRRFAQLVAGPRGDAALALGEMGQDARQAIPVLRKVARVESGWIQLDVALALASISPESAEIVHALLEALRAENLFIRLKAIQCLDRLARKERTDLLPLLNHAISDSDDLVKITAMVALKKYGPTAKKAIPSLLVVLQNEGMLSSASAAASTLEAIGPPAKVILPQLIALLKNENAEKRRLAANVLASIGHEAAASVPVLVKALQDPDGEVRKSATNALQRIDPSSMPKESVNHLPPHPLGR